MTRMEAKNLATGNATASPRPKTLRELGVPGSLAAELEAVLRVRGHHQDGRVVGYRFVTPDGVSHPLSMGEG
jgi:hypothetical protein